MGRLGCDVGRLKRERTVGKISDLYSSDAGTQQIASTLRNAHEVAAPNQMRLRDDFLHGKGAYSFIKTGLGFEVLTAAGELQRQVDARFTSEDVMKLHFRLKGEGCYALGTEDAVPMSGQFAGILLQPEGQAKFESRFQGREECWITVFCSRESLQTVFGEDLSGIPAPVREFVEGSLNSTFGAQLALTAAMARSAIDIVNADEANILARAQTEARVVDLLCETLLNLNQLAESAWNKPFAFSPRDRHCLEEAHFILQRELASPPNLKELARRVGVNPNKLNFGLKMFYGGTGGELLNRFRMEEARRLLEEEGENVTQVAYACGFNFPGNFTAAFRRHFGVLPKDVRRRGR
jgi:AraC-like DNA-binding protein